MLGTIVNTGAVILGSSIGLLVNKNLPKKYIRIVFDALGLFTLFLGVKMALEGKELLFIVFSLILGALTGQWLQLEERTEKLSDFIKKKMNIKNQHFTEGMITSFLMFCMGSMTILGAIEEGFGNEPNLLLTKSVMDGFSSVALASGFGPGVLFSSVLLFVYQGSLTLLAGYLKDFLTPEIISEITAVGGLLLIGLGVNILELKKIKVLNLIPALIYIVVFMLIFK